ncbi:DUF3348 family protein, partial [Paraburkholderia bengalensis]|uniref:DUF3348 family protein n=1 Tax=Paraburkholderia bengalensis TaxID=2747562 RepID=UPI0030154E71
MVQAPQRTVVSGPTLVRLLARLTAADAPASSQSLSDQLSQWLGWTDAIALSTALNGTPPAVARLAMIAASSVDARRARTSAAGASLASTFSACISEMRSQRSASFMKCVEMKIVTRSRRARSSHQLPEAVARNRVHARGRFVENQQFRLVHHRHRE